MAAHVSSAHSPRRTTHASVPPPPARSPGGRQVALTVLLVLVTLGTMVQLAGVAFAAGALTFSSAGVIALRSHSVVRGVGVAAALTLGLRPSLEATLAFLAAGILVALLTDKRD